jgi:hypothetical protein
MIRDQFAGSSACAALVVAVTTIGRASAGADAVGAHQSHRRGQSWRSSGVDGARDTITDVYYQRDHERALVRLCAKPSTRMRASVSTT